MDISYIINELAEDRAQYFNAVAPPIIQSSNFVFNTVASMRSAFADEYSTYLYSRGLNPTVDILRKKLAALDNAEDCLVFNNGAAATFAAVLANVKAGDNIISVDKPYTWAKKMFDKILPRFGITTTYIDGRSIQNFTKAIQPNTTLIYLESPNSWDYTLQPLQAVAQLAKAHHIVTIIDNSYCTPLYQKPIDYGIDLTLQSATKYIGGHSDTLAGVLCGSKAMIEKIFNSEFNTIGSGISPFNAWLIIRGLRTLPMRLQHITHTTHLVLNYLNNHPKVAQVLFPFDENFAQYTLAKQQMQGACGLLSFYIHTHDVNQIVAFCEHLQHIKMAVSWGGHESLIIPKCATIQPQYFNANNKDQRMLRLFVGLEEANYIIQDLERGFEKIG